jgi:DNA integrity scanning protein DisA with diadenylate cyclase activity
MDHFGAHTGWLRNALDIGIVAFLIYRMLLLIKGTRAVPMLWGLILIVLLYLVAVPLGLVTLAWFLSNFLSAIIVVVVVLFQDEIRRALTKVGLRPVYRGRDHGGGASLEGKSRRFDRGAARDRSRRVR